jgi:hypothetical protein
MGMDIRQQAEFYVDTKDPNLALKTSKIIHEATVAFKKLREEYDDKEYFDMAVQITLSSWGYAGENHVTSKVDLEKYEEGIPSEDFEPTGFDAVEKAFEALSAEE